MKNLVKLAVIVILGTVLSACTSSPTPAPVSIQLLTPTQLAARVCPAAQAVGLAVNLLPQVDPKITLGLAVAEPAITALCADGATISTDNLQDFVKKAIPALLATADAVPLDPAKLAAIKLDIGVAQILINQAIANGFAPAPLVPVVAAPPVPAALK